jgi:hypothetical protein
MNRYEPRIGAVVNALRKEGQDDWAEKLDQVKAKPVDSGTELALMWRKCLLEIVQLASLTDNTRATVSELIAEFDKGLG